jgi:hypothetical protein
MSLQKVTNRNARKSFCRKREREREGGRERKIKETL